MAITSEQYQAWLDRLEEAFSSGATSVHDADGKSVTYASRADMLATMNWLRGKTGGYRRPRRALAQASRGR